MAMPTASFEDSAMRSRDNKTVKFLRRSAIRKCDESGSPLTITVVNFASTAAWNNRWRPVCTADRISLAR
jgi:hypothetical protein